jgi:hypothetical protein
MGLQAAQFGNLAVLDSDVGAVARQPSAIDDHASSDDCIEFRHF